MKTQKNWTSPRLTSHGSVKEITAQLVKPKQLGSSDDFGVSGVADGVLS
jgi:hypothetical protein